jgi:hypothetical protein
VTLGSIAALSAGIFVFRNFRPSGFVKESHYVYVKWFMRLCCLLAFILFVQTEAVPALMGLWAAAALTLWFAAKHAPRGTNTMALSGNLWAAMLFMFGVLTGLFAISIVGILAWKSGGAKGFWKNLVAVMK